MKKYWNNEYIRGGFLLTGGNLIISSLNYLFNLLVGRVLGPAGYGDIAALFSYLYIFSVPVTVVSNLVIQRISSRGNEQLAYTRSLEHWFWNSLKRGWLILILVISLSIFVPGITHLSRAPSYLLVPLIVVTVVMSFYAAGLNGLRAFAYVTIIGIFAALIKFLGPFLEISIFSRLGTITFLLFLSQVFSLVASWWLLKRKTGAVKTNDAVYHRRMRELLTNKSLWLISLSVLGITLFNNLDVVFVKQLLGAGDAGIYGAWSLFSKMIFLAIAPIAGVAYVFFASDKDKKIKDITITVFICGLILIGIISFVCFEYFGSFVVNLMFGSRFEAVVPYLGKATIFGSCFSIVQVVNSYFMAKTSKYALLMPFLIIFFFISLIIFGKSLSIIINIDLILGLTASSLYLIAYLFERRNKE